MRGESRLGSAANANGKRRKPLPQGATDCTDFLRGVARLRWPHKTAAHWAVRAGVKERMAKYWLAGHPVSPAGKLALMREVDSASPG